MPYLLLLFLVLRFSEIYWCLRHVNTLAQGLPLSLIYDA
jgi:hypothetical protein